MNPWLQNKWGEKTHFFEKKSVEMVCDRLEGERVEAITESTPFQGNINLWFVDD